jgi:hypothetical protein
VPSPIGQYFDVPVAAYVIACHRELDRAGLFRCDVQPPIEFHELVTALRLFKSQRYGDTAFHATFFVARSPQIGISNYLIAPEYYQRLSWQYVYKLGGEEVATFQNFWSQLRSVPSALPNI